MNHAIEMRNTISSVLTYLFLPLTASAQFYTITKETPIETVSATHMAIQKGKAELVEPLDDVALVRDSATSKSSFPADATHKDRKSDQKVSLTKSWAMKSEAISAEGLPSLTIPNLYTEIKRNNIQHPKIVLAQAILETGWFSSPLCRNRHNLFGLTNPRTGKYYEFNHWTESVRAYYTKVQYRYQGGNYLLWLREIGYAEDPNYIRSVIKVLKMLYYD